LSADCAVAAEAAIAIAAARPMASIGFHIMIHPSSISLNRMDRGATKQAPGRVEFRTLGIDLRFRLFG
jgi:hypothetical protein